jgi:hypothetical protein
VSAVRPCRSAAAAMPGWRPEGMMCVFAAGTEEYSA